MSHERLPDLRHPVPGQWRSRLRRKLRSLITWAVGLGLVVAALVWLNSGEVESQPESPSPFEEAVARDPWGVAESQYRLTAEAWADGNASRAASHATNATLAAFKTIPEEGTEHRAERGITRSRDDTDIWEHSRTLAAVANASMTWASVRNEMRPDDHADNYDRSHVAWTDARAARKAAEDAWMITNMHWDESRDSDTEEAWSDATLAWAHAADSWAYAYELVRLQHSGFRGVARQQMTLSACRWSS